VIATGTSDELKSRTGAQTVTVRPASEEDHDAIAALVGGIAAGPVDQRGPVISAPVTDPAALAQLVRRLDEKGLLVAELALRSPSLDEVFLNLTGHPATEESVA
jgi:oleandomycin transport system ATP-binding protein